MFRFVRSGKIKANLPDALKWAKEIAEYANARISPMKVNVYSGLFGDLNTIFWEIEYKDLATVESVNAKLTSDPGYWNVVSKGAALFIEGTFSDSIMRQV